MLDPGGLTGLPMTGPGRSVPRLETIPEISKSLGFQNGVLHQSCCGMNPQDEAQPRPPAHLQHLDLNWKNPTRTRKRRIKLFTARERTVFPIPAGLASLVRVKSYQKWTGKGCLASFGDDEGVGGRAVAQSSLSVGPSSQVDASGATQHPGGQLLN